MKTAVEGLLNRLLHQRGREFIVEIGEMSDGRDYFKVRYCTEFLVSRPVFLSLALEALSALCSTLVVQNSKSLRV